jgi:HEAT repeat protein
MIDQSEAELKAALKGDNTEKRFMAAFVVGDRRLPWQKDLIPLLTDPNDPIRQAARRGLIILSFLVLNPDEAKWLGSAIRNRSPIPLEQLTKPPDFGPEPGASKEAQKKAVKDWTDWWAKPQGPTKPPTGGPVIPAEFPVETDPERLADALMKAGINRRKEVAANYRDLEGDQYTDALAIAITHSASAARSDIRDALIARLSKLKDEELRKCLDADQPEVRRAAVLILVKKDDKTHAGRIAEMLLDPEPVVQQVAHSALCKLSGQDFGPKNHATEDEQLAAIEKWTNWFKEKAGQQ